MIRVACLALALAAPAAAQTALPDGDWMGFPVTAIGAGLVVPIYEHLSVTGDTASQRAWTVPVTASGCTGAPTDPPACAPPVALGALRLAGDGDRVSVQPEGAQITPYDHPTDARLWPDVALAGWDWQVRGDDRRMILSREAVIEGERLTLERLYLRADPDVPGLLFDVLFVRQMSLGRAICGIDALHGDLLRWRGFVDDLRVMAPVLAELRRIDQMARAREDQLRALTLRRGPEVLGAAAADVSDLPEGARVAVLALLNPAPMAKDGPRLATLDWPAPPDLLQAEANCLAYLFDF
jgi:hypothetical protein